MTNKRNKITRFWILTFAIGIVIGLVLIYGLAVSITPGIMAIFCFTSVAGYIASIIIADKKSALVDLPFYNVMLRIFLGTMMLTTMLFLIFGVNSPYVLRAYLLYTIASVGLLYRMFKYDDTTRST